MSGGVQSPAGRIPRATSALTIVAFMLAASGALRLGSGVGEAFAQASPLEPAVEMAASKDCTSPSDALAKALSDRKAKLDAQEEALKNRMAALALADQVVKDRMAKLTAAEANLARTLAIADGAAEADLERLTAMYESMKPKQAAALFQAMTPEFAAGFLGRMQPDAAARVLAGMSAEAAYAASALLAGRNAGAPTK